jgi:hypothetical protein
MFYESIEGQTGKTFGKVGLKNGGDFLCLIKEGLDSD